MRSSWRGARPSSGSSSRTCPASFGNWPLIHRCVLCPMCRLTAPPGAGVIGARSSADWALQLGSIQTPDPMFVHKQHLPEPDARYGFRAVLTSRPSMMQIDAQIMVQSRVTSRPDSGCLGETCLERHSVIPCCNRPSCRGIHLHAVVFMGRLFLHWFPINTSSLFSLFAYRT